MSLNPDRDKCCVQASNPGLVSVPVQLVEKQVRSKSAPSLPVQSSSKYEKKAFNYSLQPVQFRLLPTNFLMSELFLSVVCACHECVMLG